MKNKKTPKCIYCRSQNVSPFKAIDEETLKKTLKNGFKPAQWICKKCGGTF